MATEPVTGLTYQEAGSLQTDALQNAELNYYGAWLNCAVLTIGDAAPPGSPANGDCYIVGTGTGDWATHDDELAVYRDGWQFYAPKEGAQALNLDDGFRYAFTSGAWDTIVVSGAGDASGPASSVDDRIATFDGTTGKLLQDGGKTIAELRAPAIQAVTSSATVTPTFSDDMVKITAQAAGLTLANPTGTAIPGLGMVIRIKDNGTARAISYGTQYRAIGITLPTTTVISKTTYIAMIYNSDDTKWDCIATGTEA